MSIVLVVFMALAGFLIFEMQEPLVEMRLLRLHLPARMAGTSNGRMSRAPFFDVPILFLFRALGLFLSGNDQLVVIQAHLDILLVHAWKFGRHFEGILCFRHTDCRCASSNV
jgi:hypothetical protein